MLSRTTATEHTETITEPKRQYRLVFDSRTLTVGEENIEGPHITLDVFLDSGGSFSRTAEKGVVTPEQLTTLQELADRLFRETMKLHGFTDDGQDAKAMALG
jgi:hypothetical protein